MQNAGMHHVRWSRPDVQCGIPIDAKYFDESGVDAMPEVGQEIVLARFELPPQYCGVLEYFAQFTDTHAKDPSRIATPGLVWRVLANGSPLYPYIGLRAIVNPWGNGSFQVAIRLVENATVELAVRHDKDQPDVKLIGGRIVGRYWYNVAFGDVERLRY